MGGGILSPLQICDVVHAVFANQRAAVILDVPISIPIALNALGMHILLIPSCRDVSATYVMTRIACFETDRGTATYATAPAVWRVPQSDITTEHFIEFLNLGRHTAGIVRS